MGGVAASGRPRNGFRPPFRKRGLWAPSRLSEPMVDASGLVVEGGETHDRGASQVWREPRTPTARRGEKEPALEMSRFFYSAHGRPALGDFPGGLAKPNQTKPNQVNGNTGRYDRPSCQSPAHPILSVDMLPRGRLNSQP